MKRSPLRRVSRKQARLNREIAAWSKAVRERDGRCVGPERGLPGVCWGELHAHHVNRDRRDNRLENGVTLCTWHHVWGGRDSVHGNPTLGFQLGLLLSRHGEEVTA